ncbi:glycoside hydrolase family 30 beta sandwich domain-containing protein [Kutzneria buriramensis]|uniref:Glucosylceramidase n=1 Tax=Kutzneria buriramensis TaxID=1045776 RepID=A0A3E0HPD3_9PSEU|nr:glycoside hydrolase family 30 beta sandwich domain-containing protein [Kutzneria buriramensis]REH48382.1 glucosylceramidase [Kutzneria buriramensis]
MRPRLLLTIAVAAAAIAVPATGRATTAPAVGSAPPPNPTSVHEWLTMPDVTTPTDTQLPLNDTVTKAPVTVHVDGGVRYQSVSGFGAAITDSSAHVLYGLTPDARDQVMRNLFDPRTGAGLSFLRQPIGASDFAVGQDYSYDDMPAGQTDYQLRHFSIAHDEAQILPLVRQALKLNPRIQIVASPWSMPGWMKTSGSMIDGNLIDDPRIYRAYALYLVKFIQAYQRAGVPVDYITVQNEPQALERKNYPGTDLPWEQEAKVIEALGPAIRAAGLHTKILAFDHNWTEHPGDISSHQRANEDPEPNYPYDLLGTDAYRWVAGTAYHCYFGDPTAQTGLRASFPDKDIFMTECEGGDSSTVIGVMQNWGRSSIDWNIALDENHGPHLGGCGSCNGTITVNSVTHEVTYNDQYRDLGHFSRFVPAGAVHIGSTVDTTSSKGAPLTTVAFTDPDHSTVLVALNTGATTQNFTVVYGTHSFDATLPAGGTVTFQWSAIH